MPFHTAAGLASKNKFIFNEDSSEDEGVTVDPLEMLNKATTKAIRQAKADAKNAKQSPPVRDEAPKKEEAPVKKREPRANNQPRKGPRRERAPKDGDAQDGDNKQVERRNRDGDDRRPPRNQDRRPRNQDRRSGDPRTGRKAQEKRGGAGTGNWGKADENVDETTEVEKATPEGETPENADNANPEENENAEPAEPKIELLTLEEWEAQQAGDASDAKKTDVRQANDGQNLKGRELNKKKVFSAAGAGQKSNANAARENNKQHVSNKFIGFQSDYESNRRNDRRGGDRPGGDRRGGDRPRGKRNDRPGKAGAMANIDDTTAFPALGK